MAEMGRGANACEMIWRKTAEQRDRRGIQDGMPIETTRYI
jgi:hypothetical protein